MFFHMSVSSSVSSNGYFQRRPWDIDFKDMDFHLSASLNVSSNHHFQGRLWDIDCKDMVFHLFKLTCWEKALGHWLQEYEFSPECTLKCCLKLIFTENALGHWLHGYGFSPECILKCCFKLYFREKDFWQILHENCFFSCVSPWVSISFNYKTKSFFTMRAGIGNFVA